MKVVLQKVTQASVEVDDKIVGKIADGLVLLVGVTHDDIEKDVDWLVEKICKLKIFSENGSESFMEKNIKDIGGSVLLVSQFTLLGNCRKGTKPSFTESAPPEHAEKLYEYMISKFGESDVDVQTGKFGAHMEVEIINDGPVTLLLDSKKS